MGKSFGLIGLGVMGKSLARNLARHGFDLALFNRHVPGQEEDVARDFIRHFPELSQASGFEVLRDFVQDLERPCKIFLMVNAGAATDAVIDELLPLLQTGDVVMDGGNAHYADTQRRMERLQAQGLHFLGTGVSGGEAGALSGPAVMPGGSADAYALVRPFLEAIAARDKDGNPCCAHVGAGGAGHFVKMVHNGVEYAEMQLIAEAYHILRRGMGMSPDEIADVFAAWNAGPEGSYLLGISVDILRKKSLQGWLLDDIHDAASNKGTGGWATAAAAELGVPATLLTEALFSRFTSSFWKERHEMTQKTDENHENMVFGDVASLQAACQLARLVNHHQGFQLLAAASSRYAWDLPLTEIARIWTNGCIIRSALMEQLRKQVGSHGSFLLLHPENAVFVQQHLPALTQTTCAALAAGLASPCLAAALSHLHALRDADSPMNLVQAQRDYFGAHTYRLKTDPTGPAQHTNWER
jgi:6-phosphogluconate dehydrogenase